MSYATPSDVSKRIAPEILLRLSADAPATARDDSAIQGWLDSASETINGVIGTRYVTPVSVTTAPAGEYGKLTQWEADIAAYNAYAYRGVADNDNPWKARHDSIVSKNGGILFNIAAGTMDLPGCAEQTGSTKGKLSPHAGFDSERQHFEPRPLFGHDYHRSRY